MFIYFQHDRIGKKNLGDVINGPPLDPSDPFASDEDAALRALARQFENRYVSIFGLSCLWVGPIVINGHIFQILYFLV